jgi:hypothetical protein
LIRRMLLAAAALGYQGGSTGDRLPSSSWTGDVCTQTPADRLVIRLTNNTCLYVEVLAGSGTQATPTEDYMALMDNYGNTVVVRRRAP